MTALKRWKARSGIHPYLFQYRHLGHAVDYLRWERGVVYPQASGRRGDASVVVVIDQHEGIDRYIGMDKDMGITANWTHEI